MHGQGRHPSHDVCTFLALYFVPGSTSYPFVNWWIKFYGAAVGSLGTLRILTGLLLVLQGYLR